MRGLAFSEQLASSGQNDAIIMGIETTLRDQYESRQAHWAARLLNDCDYHELPVTVTSFLASIYELFPSPPPIKEDLDGVEADAGQNGQ